MLGFEPRTSRVSDEYSSLELHPIDSGQDDHSHPTVLFHTLQPCPSPDPKTTIGAMYGIRTRALLLDRQLFFL